MKSTLLALFLSLISASTVVFATNLVIELEINGAIGPATQDYIQRGIETAEKKNAEVIIIKIDTPGGLETSMRGINKSILASKIPVIAFVAPTGARAASAGTFILYASHIAAMAPGTNLGAASPVGIGGGENSNSNSNSQTATLEKKSKNDAAAYIKSLAILRGRNEDWAEKAVREAVSLSSTEALKIKVIDMLAKDIDEVLEKIQGRKIEIEKQTKVIAFDIPSLNREVIKPDWRYQILSIITDPNIAYILLLAGIYGLFFEFSNPGFILPGVIGAISLLIALYAFQLLPISYAGFALLTLGIVFMISEVFVTSYGILGMGGIVAFVVGSIMLLDTQIPGYGISWSLILFMSLISAAFFLSIFHLALAASQKKIVSGRETLLGEIGEVVQVQEELRVRIQGETWKAKLNFSENEQEKAQALDNNLSIGEKIRVVKVTGLTLIVERLVK